MNSDIISKQEYESLVKKVSPNSKTASNCIKAFFVGGSICLIGQLLVGWFTGVGASAEDAMMYTALILIAAAILLTAIGKFDNIVKFAGAGASVPITGFANAMSAPCLEFKKEGLVLGMAAKMFLIAGPVIVYGTLASMVVGLIYFLVGR